jgi:ribonuclease P protein component
VSFEPTGELVSADGANQRVEESVRPGRADFPRAARLLKHSDFDRVYKQGRRHFSSHMTVFYLRRAESTSPEGASAEERARVGFTVGKVLGGAVARNRIKRKLREAVRRQRAVLAGAGAVDVVINPKKSVLALKMPLLLEEVGRALDAVTKKLGNPTLPQNARKDGAPKLYGRVKGGTPAIPKIVLGMGNVRIAHHPTGTRLTIKLDLQAA